MRILITGATGLIGQELVKRCRERNIGVHFLTSNKAKLANTEHYKGFYWNVKTQDIDTKCFVGVDAIVHLAGATISKRWTSENKKEIVSSRTQTAQLLINALKGESHTIKQVISASAIGIYPDSLINYYDETFKISDVSFLSHVLIQSEQAVDAFAKLNINVCKIRIGLVLAANGGLLPEMVRPIKLGLGAAFGTGKQWQSWIHIYDLSNIFMFALEHGFYGIYNGVAPNPVTNNEFTKAIAHVLGKPLFLPNIPKPVMKFILGDMHTLLFESQRVSSKKIETKGFHFEHHHLRSALYDLLG